MARVSPDVQEEWTGGLVVDPGVSLPRRPYPVLSKLPLVLLLKRQLVPKGLLI